MEALDPYIWLESIHASRAVNWVRRQNTITKTTFMDSPEFAVARAKVFEVLDCEKRIPYVRRMGRHLYNFWQDSAHPNGILRRTTLRSYRSAYPTWRTVLDIDALNASEHEQWTLSSAKFLKPEHTRCLIMLSPDGGDAVETREFDLPTQSFVKDGFFVPVAKTNVSWIDLDHLYVSTNFGPGTMTKSGYPRLVKVWGRNAPEYRARTVYAGAEGDLEISAWRDRTPGFERDFIRVQRDFYHSDRYIVENGELVKLDVPSDAEVRVHRQWILVRLRTPWVGDHQEWRAGALIVAKFSALLNGKRDFTTLFRPDKHTALLDYAWTRNAVVMVALDDVRSSVYAATAPQMGCSVWARSVMPNGPTFGSTRIVAADPGRSGEYWLTSSGFLTPPRLGRAARGDKRLEVIKHEPDLFDATQFSVTQHWAASADGTRVPYFEVAPAGVKLDGTNRTLEYGYGGFEVPMIPQYSGVVGRAWLCRGGVYVVANVRGGGEYGPRWHEAAVGANRVKAYQDFVAVAQDLVKRRVTSPRHLGAVGRSNGGLLAANMLTKHPDLFGAVCCQLPLLDMKRYTSLAAGSSWIAEYGDPDDVEQWRFIKRWSPYQNLRPNMCYPPALFYTTTSDDRVGPAQARKMVAKMQAMGYPNVWLYESPGGGHSTGTGNEQAATIDALVYEFLWSNTQ